MKNPALTELIDQIHAAQCIALILHISPDGDTCGSALALRRALVLQGKTVACVCDNEVPHIYEDLEGAQTVVRPETLQGEAFDLCIAIDVADRARMGDSVAVFDSAEHTAQIDHHHTNPAYAQVNVVRSPLSATGVLVLEAIDALGVEMDLAMAKCIYVAVATDTGNFKQQNTDAAALEAAARCIAAGLDASQVTRRVFDVRPLSQTKLLARALVSLTLHAGGEIAIMRLTNEDFRQTGALPEHTEGIVNFAINTEGVEMACLISQPIKVIRCSLRSLPPHDVSRVATALGGGGHALAAGCTLEPPMEEALERVQAEMLKEMART